MPTRRIRGYVRRNIHESTRIRSQSTIYARFRHSPMASFGQSTVNWHSERPNQGFRFFDGQFASSEKQRPIPHTRIQDELHGKRKSAILTLAPIPINPRNHPKSMCFCAMVVAVITRSGNREHIQATKFVNFAANRARRRLRSFALSSKKLSKMLRYVAQKNWENQKKLILLFICIP